MQQRKSKKILIYFFLLLAVGSINNINVNKFKIKSVNDINIIGLDIKDKLILLKQIKNLNLNNIFSINKEVLINEIESNSLVENYLIIVLFLNSISHLLDGKKYKFFISE